MSDTSGHEADQGDAVLRAKAPSPRALLFAAVAAVLTTAGLVAVAVASAQGV